MSSISHLVLFLRAILCYTNNVSKRPIDSPAKAKRLAGLQRPRTALLELREGNGMSSDATVCYQINALGMTSAAFALIGSPSWARTLTPGLVQQHSNGCLHPPGSTEGSKP